MPANQSSSLLGDIKVVELSTMVFGPAAGAILADFGAQIIKVEPLEGDLNRGYHQLPGMPESEIPYTFQADNRNKRSLSIDLKSEAGSAALGKLIEEADIFLTNYRTQGLARLGLDYESLAEKNPRIIYAAGTGYGDNGDEAGKPGYDNVCYFSRSGIETTLFPFDGWLPAFPFGAGDHPSATALFAGVMTALYRRKSSGEGCKVSTSLLANGAWANATLLSAQLSNAQFREKRHRSRAYNFMSLHYRARDGRLLKLGMVNAEKDWAPLCRLLSRPELIEDPRFIDTGKRAANMEALIAELDAAFGEQDIAYWLDKFEFADIPYSIVPTYEEAANDRQKIDNDIIIPLEHPQYGELRTINSPFALSGVEKVKPTAAPKLGEHSREVLTEMGYDDELINKMIEDGLIRV